MRGRGGSSHLTGQYFQGSVRRSGYQLRRCEDGRGGRNGEWEKVLSQRCVK